MGAASIQIGSERNIARHLAFVIPGVAEVPKPFHSGDVAFEHCYLPDMPAVLRALAGAENSIEKCGSSSTRPKHPEGSFKVVNALAMAASYDPDPTESLGIRLTVDLRHLRGHRRPLGKFDAAGSGGRGRSSGG